MYREVILEWAPWVGIWEVRVQFLLLLPTLWATLGHPTAPLPTHTHWSLSLSVKKGDTVIAQISSSSNILSS